MPVGYKTVLRVQTVSTEHFVGKDIIVNMLGWEQCEDQNRTTWNITHFFVHKPLHRFVKFFVKIFQWKTYTTSGYIVTVSPLKSWVFVRLKLSLYCKSSLYLLYFFSENNWGFWDHFFLYCNIATIHVLHHGFLS